MIQGDTFPVGCKPGSSIVYGEESFHDNPDIKDAMYNTRLGMYEKGCGMENVLMSWGHDEYLYQVIMNHLKQAQIAKSFAISLVKFRSNNKAKQAC